MHEDSIPTSSEDASDPNDQNGVELLLAMSAASTGVLSADLDQTLELATRFFNLEYGILSRVEGDHYIIENVVQPDGAGLEPGQSFELGTTYCAITLKAHDVVSIADMENSPHSGHPCYECFQLEAYLGVPLRVDGSVYGTLNFSSTKALDRGWTDIDRQLVRLLAKWIEGSISQDRLSRRLARVLEELDRANQQLISRNRSLDHFARHASHDLQAPLKNITSLTTMLTDDLDGTGSVEVEQSLDLLASEAQRMKKIVEALLEFSRVSDGPIKLDDVPLDRCVDAALKALREDIREADAEVTRESLPVVRGDLILLTQAFQNLIGNAIKFRSPGRRPRVHISACEKEGRVTTSVADNGIGFEPKYAEQIFNPLERLHGPQSYPGSGLGLSICCKIVERQGGRVTAESTPDEGSVFSLTLNSRDQL